LLISASVVVGLFPGLLLNLITPSFDLPVFEGLRRACGL